MARELLIDRLRKAGIDPDRRHHGMRLLTKYSAAAAKRGRRDLSRMNSTLSTARVFRLDDEVARLAATISTRSLDELLRRLPLARPPHTTTWIEWREAARLDVLAEYGIAELADPGEAGHVGFLIESLDRGGDTPIYRITSATELLGYPDDWEEPHPEGVNIQGIGFLLDPHSQAMSDRLTPRERDLNKEIRTLESRLVDKSGQSGEMPGLYAFGGAYLQKQGLQDPSNENLRRISETYSRLAPHVRYTMAPPHGTAYTELAEIAAAGRGSTAHDQRGQVLTHMLKDNAGDIRFVIALLSLLNDRPVTENHHETKPGHRMTICGRNMPYMERHTIRLTVPRTRAEQMLASHETGPPRRAHEVRGTMCYSRKLDASCDHDWAPAHGSLETCRKCGGRRWWRRPHMRGDARIGFVHKDYLVDLNRDSVQQ